jgi:hypothetical protein
LTARLEKIVLSEKMIKENLSRVEESASKSTYKLGVRFERCEKKGEKSAPKFVPSSIYHKEEEALKPTKTHYPSNLKSSFKPKRDVKKETPKAREEVFVWMFCDRASYLDEFCFHHKRIEKMRFNYAINSYRDEFSNFSPRSFSRALPRTFSRALSLFSHRPNHYSYDFGSQENNFVSRRFGYGSHPHRGDHFLCRPSFSARGSRTHPEPRHLDDPCFSHHGSHPTRPNGEVQKTVKISSCHMVKC